LLVWLEESFGADGGRFGPLTHFAVREFQCSVLDKSELKLVRWDMPDDQCVM
jgi:hypothetical protein